MKKSILAAGCLLLMAGLSFGANELLSLTSSGNNSITLNSGTTSFSLTVSDSWTGYSSLGLSYWLQVPTSVASNFSITNVTYGSTFSSANASGPSTVLFNDSISTDGAASGFTLETRDLGSTVGVGNPAVAPAGTIQATTMTINLNGLAPGTYTLESTFNSSRISEQSDSSNPPGDHPFENGTASPATFTITVVPEPATLSLFGLGALGSFGLNVLRRRRRS
jgi:hypothetical protein